MTAREAIPYALTIEKYYHTLQNRVLVLTLADWSTIEEWHRLGIPVECVLKGMDRAFSRQHLHINSLQFCDWAVREVCRETCSVLTRL
jgi:hypothetical protein